jgi:hypothetical protein
VAKLKLTKPGMQVGDQTVFYPDDTMTDAAVNLWNYQNDPSLRDPDAVGGQLPDTDVGSDSQFPDSGMADDDASAQADDTNPDAQSSGEDDPGAANSWGSGDWAKGLDITKTDPKMWGPAGYADPDTVNALGQALQQHASAIAPVLAKAIDPSFGSVATDAYGAPLQQAPGLTKLGKLLQIVGSTARGAGAGAGQPTFSAGWQEAQKDPYSDAMMRAALALQGAQTGQIGAATQLTKAQIQSLPMMMRLEMLAKQADMQSKMSMAQYHQALANGMPAMMAARQNAYNAMADKNSADKLPSNPYALAVMLNQATPGTPQYQQLKGAWDNVVGFETSKAQAGPGKQMEQYKLGQAQIDQQSRNYLSGMIGQYKTMGAALNAIVTAMNTPGALKGPQLEWARRALLIGGKLDKTGELQ